MTPSGSKHTIPYELTRRSFKTLTESRSEILIGIKTACEGDFRDGKSSLSVIQKLHFCGEERLIIGKDQ
jgi:hypothetical protein